MYINKNILGAVIAVLAIGGLVYAASRMNTTDVVVPEPSATTAAPVQPTTPTTPSSPLKPGAPIVTTSTSVVASNSTANVTGTINPNGSGTAYWFDYGTTTSFGAKTLPQSLGAGYGTISAPTYISGLKANTTYYYRLTGENMYGTVSGVTHTFQTNSNPPTPVVLPIATTYSTNDVQRNSAIVKGQVNTNGVAANFWFEYGTSTNLGAISTIQTLDATTGSRDVNMQVLNLASQTKYYYRINAQNQFGTVHGSILSFTTTGPANNEGAPEASTDDATNVAKNSATFNGRIDPNGVATTYWFEYGTTPALLSLTVTASQNLAAGQTTKSVSLPVAGLGSSTKYYYRVIAQNQYGLDYGDIESFTTKR